MAHDLSSPLIIPARAKDLGGFSVRRVLPYASRRMVGPFIFFDHMGPATLMPGDRMMVRPHPHINLATVTYLFEGKVHHRDSLGSDQVIEPGAVNWMTAGRGIVHSERTPADIIKTGSKMNGIQLWVALPEEFEETAPTFHHHPKATLPEFSIGDAKAKLLLGSALGQKSPVKVFSDMFYLEVFVPKGSRVAFPAENREAAFYVVTGEVDVSGQKVSEYEMWVNGGTGDFSFTAQEASRVMILGGVPLGQRQIYWNFVSSSKERLEEAKRLWREGPNETNPRFKPVPGDESEFIPLPNE